MNNLNDLLSVQQFAEQSISAVLVNLFLCMMLVSLVGWFYKKYSRSLGGKTHVGAILPLIGLTVFMVITVVKSSLALSLGLVGALSIVRFRTPIKEPEELGYLFLTIAVGLGFGAGFSLITTIITFAILIYLFMVGTSRGSSKVDGEYTLLVKLSQNKYNEVTNVIDQKVTAYKIIRTENTGNKINAYFNISVGEDFNFQELIDALKNTDSDIDFNMVESGVNW
jgi:uncharacterized membrane protein YhiD involved in acid resistance|tara:strand:- start:498 stop:1169 length:672 start_codon:yes stop_codon:yes gene_type:complete